MNRIREMIYVGLKVFKLLDIKSFEICMVRLANEILGYELGEDIGEGGQARLLHTK